ncbi:hypothetical protein HMPREF1008_00091 [Olsenella sp. oral taxon 809 str. F0356]|uniref:lytic transglycosylase domain-containing protein n=1 Tax=Olsenella sp. oral taxon 809 TaxID=661086 RepID=UPI000231EF89|nr:lytic transglycosylase domain-containing protein [Olsenella sp. oral taxon 809]EHF03050.1 hypothetical protein HMPREF1008_00091 [Olsenella sp. oral taxon 809 str. F0356]
MRHERFFRWFRTIPILVMLAVCALTFAADLAPRQVVRQLLFPVSHASQINESSSRHGVDPYLTCAVIKCESGWNADASSSAGAVGLMQLLPATASEMARLGLVDSSRYDPSELTDPATNIEYGTAYLAYLQKALGSRDEVIAAYNAGVGNVQGWLSGGGEISSKIEYAETAAYLVRVNEAYDRYQELYPEGVSDSSLALS